MPRLPQSPPAFQAAANIGRLPRPLRPALCTPPPPPFRSSHPPRAPARHHPTRSGPPPPPPPPPPSSVLKDAVIAVPSAVPADRHHPVKVSLRAESLGGRRRRVMGGVHIAASPARVWAVLTAYDRIERYMPNILSSILEHRDGAMLLDQVGLISNKLGLTSRMLVRVEEDRPQRSILFTRVEGRDFSEFVGRYFVREADDGAVRLDYELVAMPFPLFPMYLVERKIFKEIPKMLAAIREEAILGRHIAFKEE